MKNDSRHVRSGCSARLSLPVASAIPKALTPRIRRFASVLLLPLAISLSLSPAPRPRRRERELFQTLLGVSHSLGETLDLRQVLHRLLWELDRVFETDISSVRLLNPGTNTLVVKASGADTREVFDDQIEIQMGEGFIGAVAKTGEPFITSDISRDPRYAVFPKAQKKVASAMAAPIKIADRTVGVVSCASSSRRRFSARDLELLTTVAGLAASAIEKAELYQQLLSRGEAVLESIADGLLVVDRQGHVAVTNRSARGLLDVRPGLGEPMEDVSRGRIQGWRKFCRDVRNMVLEDTEEIPPGFTTELNLEERVIRAGASPVLSQWRKVIGGVIKLEDITDALRMTAELAAEKSKLEAVLENVAVGVLATNDAGEVLLANSAAFHLLGVARPWWWLGGTLEETVPEPGIARLIRRSLTRGEETVAQTVVLDSGRHLQISCVPIRELSPGQPGAVAVFHDVTGIHELKAASGALVSMVSSELRAPLTAIKAYIETLQRDDVAFDDASRAEFISVIARETERLVGLVDDMQDVSRIEAGGAGFNRSVVDLTRLVRDVVEKIEPRAEGHALMLDLAEHPVRVLAEPEKVEQAMLNVLSDALKSSPEASPLEISVRAIEGNALVSVADHGLVITEAQLPFFFDSYYRVGRHLDAGTREPGFGLFVAKTIIEAHGGRVWAESRRGEGTTVVFTVPLAEPHDAPLTGDGL